MNIHGNVLIFRWFDHPYFYSTDVTIRYRDKHDTEQIIFRCMIHNLNACNTFLAVYEYLNLRFTSTLQHITESYKMSWLTSINTYFRWKEFDRLTRRKQYHPTYIFIGMANTTFWKCTLVLRVRFNFFLGASHVEETCYGYSETENIILDEIQINTLQTNS